MTNTNLTKRVFWSFSFFFCPFFYLLGYFRMSDRGFECISVLNCLPNEIIEDSDSASLVPSDRSDIFVKAAQSFEGETKIFVCKNAKIRSEKDKNHKIQQMS